VSEKWVGYDWSATAIVAFGIVRFLSLALWWPKDDSPTDAMLRDKWFLLNLAAAAATMLGRKADCPAIVWLTA
jgi:hypothetical protein